MEKRRKEGRGGVCVCVGGGGGEDIAIAALFLANSAACDGKCETNAFVFLLLFGFFGLRNFRCIRLRFLREYDEKR